MLGNRTMQKMYKKRTRNEIKALSRNLNIAKTNYRVHIFYKKQY